MSAFQTNFQVSVSMTLSSSSNSTSPHRQLLCASTEGWGPASLWGWDLTPCAEHALVVLIAASGIVLGSIAVWFLVHIRQPRPLARGWHFYVSLALFAILIAASVVEAALRIHIQPGDWFNDIQFWSTIISLLSFGVILSVQYLEYRRSLIPNGLVLLYWLFYDCVHIIVLRSLVIRGFARTQPALFAVVCCNAVSASLLFFWEWLVPKARNMTSDVIEHHECPHIYSSMFSHLTFSWLTPLMRYGRGNHLALDDLWYLRERDSAQTNVDLFETYWEEECQKEAPSIWVAILKSYGSPFAAGVIFKIVSDCLMFTQPQLLRLLITFIETYPAEPVARGATIAASMFIFSALQTLLFHQYYQRAFETGMRIRSGLSSAIYKKAMRLSREARGERATGDIVNHMAVDIQRLQDFCQYGTFILSAPFQVFLCLFSLYRLVGIAMLAGFAVIAAILPINWLVAKLMEGLKKQQMGNKDARSRFTTEVLRNIKSIKLYSWGTTFLHKLNFMRNRQELVVLKKIGYLGSITAFVWDASGFLVGFSTFLTLVLTTDRVLTTEIVFPALALFNLLGLPMTLFPAATASFIESLVALRRLSRFFSAEENQINAITHKPKAERNGDTAVQVKSGTFSHNRFKDSHVLVDVNLTARKGDLSCIVGRVGSGKSSILEAILGDLFKVNGSVTVYGSVAYAAQSPWLMDASVKDNILFGHRLDPGFYDRTVKACALLADFDSLPDGDATEVGDRGIALSGGQRARLSLARAVYARADVYLLDDVLSAVDAHVGRHIIDSVLGPKGLLKSKARILATNSIPVLAESDQVLFLEGGRLTRQEDYKKFATDFQGDTAGLIQAMASSARETRSEQDGSRASQELQPERSTESASTKTTAVPGDMADYETSTILPESLDEHQAADLDLTRTRTVSFCVEREALATDKKIKSITKQSDETTQQGKVKWSTYGGYMRSSDMRAVIVFLVMTVAGQCAEIGTGIWLKQWTKNNENAGHNSNASKWIGGYFALGFAGAALSVMQTLVLYISCCITASQNLHERMASAVLRSSMSFFETTPSGRILNRFTSDIFRIDEVMPRILTIFFYDSGQVAATMIIIAVSTPPFIALFVPLLMVYIYIQSFYLTTSRQLKRLESVTRSPIFAHFQESIQGLTTIRAYGQQTRFVLENQHRVDLNIQAYFPSFTANRWLAVRVEFLGAIIILFTAGLAILYTASGRRVSAGLVGLCLAYALRVTQRLNWIVLQAAEVETSMISVERVLEYIELPSEAPEIQPENRPPASWPSEGQVEFRDYSTRYRPGLGLVLKDVNISIKPREKIGIVGRTGAGKSSLTLALFRLIEAAEGRISIDGITTSTIGLTDLRHRLAIIPQDAALFEGTLRENLDPEQSHTDEELWQALQHAQLKDHVQTLDLGLQARISEGGNNLSHGQKQLVALTRALLVRSNILVLDEATATVDAQTDALLQETLRSPAFGDCTIITIAHRINTILDSDRVLVLDKGRVVEFDTPVALMEKEGLFHSLVKEAGLVDRVRK